MGGELGRRPAAEVKLTDAQAARTASDEGAFLHDSADVLCFHPRLLSGEARAAAIGADRPTKGNVDIQRG